MREDLTLSLTEPGDHRTLYPLVLRTHYTVAVTWREVNLFNLLKRVNDLHGSGLRT